MPMTSSEAVHRTCAIQFKLWHPRDHDRSHRSISCLELIQLHALNANPLLLHRESECLRAKDADSPTTPANRLRRGERESAPFTKLNFLL